MPFAFLYRCRAICSVLLLSTLTAGCATPLPPPPLPVANETPAVQAREYVPVVRYSRYTLVELAPTAAQHDLLLQVIDVSIPDTLHASVGNALRHVLRRSGYRLCDGPDTEALNALPLPVAHYHLGPLLLRDALLTLVGPAWDLHVDDGARRVCFSQAADPPAEPAAQNFPVPPAGVRIEPLPHLQEEQP
ncbi:hypothetical protein [Thauera sinica]|uniref:Integrating conjugative element protein pill, pfgi-1 n=1 Tax=Thauera sinica TaxID=2665146 RepID=A0ABW1AYA5_9RHOO